MMTSRFARAVAAVLVAGLIAGVASCVGDDPAVTSDAAAAAGILDGPCFSNGTCDFNLVCVGNRCARAEGGAANETGPAGGDASVDAPSDSTADGKGNDGAAEASTPTSFKTMLNAGSVVPTSTAPGSGSANLTYYPDTMSLCGKLTYTALGEAPTGAHVHFAGAGLSGPAILSFSDMAGTYKLNGTLSPTNVSSLWNGEMYVDIHTGSFSGGAIRGQLAIDPGGTLQPCQ